MNTPLIKWTGSKRSMAAKIISYFPNEIKTYYEPFCGGGSVFFTLLKSDKKIDNFIISDKNSSLIEIYKLVRDNPESLIEEYSKHWGILQDNPKHFYTCRDEYNSTKCPILFYFLTRTCYNGTIRYNSKGEFNTSHHFGRPGMNPREVAETIRYYNSLMLGRDIEFISQSFENVTPKNDKDVIYVDPPYTNTKALYFGNISLKEFLTWLNQVQCSWFMNINGVSGKDNEENIDIPFTEKVLLPSGNSAFSRLKGNHVKVSEYFYYKLK